jgi:hypothetical protein
MFSAVDGKGKTFSFTFTKPDTYNSALEGTRTNATSQSSRRLGIHRGQPEIAELFRRFHKLSAIHSRRFIMNKRLIR